MRQPVAPSRWKRAVRRFPAGQKVHRARGDLPAARRPQHRLDQAPDFFAAPEAAPPRAAVPEVERLAEAVLAEGDGPRAERRFSSLLREAPAPPSRCQCHVGLLAAAELREPWGGAVPKPHANMAPQRGRFGVRIYEGSIVLWALAEK